MFTTRRRSLFCGTVPGFRNIVLSSLKKHVRRYVFWFAAILSLIVSCTSVAPCFVNMQFTPADYQSFYVTAAKLVQLNIDVLHLLTLPHQWKTLFYTFFVIVFLSLTTAIPG